MPQPNTSVNSVSMLSETTGSLIRCVHFYSLDAVLVAIVWQSVFGIAWRGRHAQAGPMFALGLIVWLVYTADRLLDARSLRLNQLATARHHFHRIHFSKLAKAWCFGLVCLMVLAVTQIDQHLNQSAVVVGSWIAIYAYQVHSGKSRWIHRTKEVQVAILFAIGITMDSWGYVFRMDWFEFVALLPSVLLMALLFLLNCLHVSIAEHSCDPFQREESIGSWISRVSDYRVSISEQVMTWGHAVLLALSIVSFALGFVPITLSICLVTSSIVMQVVNQQLSFDVKQEWTGLAMDLSIAIPPLVVLMVQRTI